MASWLTGGGGSSGTSGPRTWINLENAAQVKSVGELTGEKSAFEFLELSRQQRIIGFVSCLGAGFVLSLLGSILLLTGSLALFAVLYSIGIIISLVGTGFLIGFGKQLTQMFKPVRIVATIVFFAAFAMVWVAAFALDSEALAIVMVVVLYLAYAWYCLSYIPYARSLVKNIFAKVF